MDASADATKKLPSSDGGSPGVDASADATMLSSDGMSVVGPCGPATCRGCCANDICHPGTDGAKCGSGGSACESCAAGSVCAGQQCSRSCDAGNCPGCCAGNQCLVGMAPNACGHGGAQCADCTSVGGSCAPSDADAGGTCHAPALCNASTCPAGCCDANGACRFGDADDACGAAGTSCRACPPSGACDNGRCLSCTAKSCPDGCCDEADTCHPGTSDAMCGVGGDGCQSCSDVGFTCVDQSCTIPVSAFCQCDYGCCDALNRCQPGSANAQCGTGGDACSDCTADGLQCIGQGCVDKTDVSVCDVETCPTGCCDLFGACQQGIANTMCGGFGADCQDCLQRGELCSNQQCTPRRLPDGGPVCDSLSCQGCCDPSGNCVLSSDSQCGANGQLCVDCTTFAGTCGGSVCVAPDGGTMCAQSCSFGCCDSNGVCHAGFIDTQCGEWGNACADCTALQPPSTCDLGVQPRACTSQQMLCPAPYPGCPAALQLAAPVRQHVCSKDDLLSVASACSGGPYATSCLALGANSPCSNCLAAFEYDFSAQIGVRECVAPYVSATCNHNSACLTDCLTQVCYHCADAMDACDVQAQSGACAAFTPADACVTQALNGVGAVCNPNTYQGNFGAWLQAVGAKYCGL